MGLTKGDLEARAWAERTSAAQGLAVKVRDPRTIEATVALLGQTRQMGSTRSASKRVLPRTAGPTIARSRIASTIER
jgi:hypothetical protein